MTKSLFSTVSALPPEVIEHIYLLTDNPHFVQSNRRIYTILSDSWVRARFIFRVLGEKNRPSTPLPVTNSETRPATEREPPPASTGPIAAANIRPGTGSVTACQLLFTSKWLRRLAASFTFGDMENLLLCLLGFGADPTVEEHFGLKFCVENGYLAAVRWMLGAGKEEHSRGNMAGGEGKWPSQPPQLSRAEWREKLDVNIGDGRPLKTACHNGDFAMAHILLRAGADPTVGDFYPVRIAAQGGHLPIVKLLVEEYGCLEGVIAHGGYALRFATIHGHFEVVEYLIGLKISGTTSAEERYRPKDSWGMNGARRQLYPVPL